MRTNTVKQTLAGGGTALGTMAFAFDSPALGPVAANAGAEFVIFDMEHSSWGIDTIRMLLASSRAADLIPIVRPPATQYHLLAGPLDAGAMGLMVPMVESEEQTRLVVQSAKYPPLGKRGAAFGLAHDDFAGGDIVEKMARANNETLLIAQIETAAGVEEADRIAAVDGIDVLWIGHNDLSISLGIPGQFDHPDFLGAVGRVLASCNRHGKAAGIMAANPATAIAAHRDGFRAIAYSGDLWIYGTALQQGLDGIRSALDGVREAVSDTDVPA